MRSMPCPRESEVLDAHRRGDRDASIAAHLGACSTCADAVAAELALAPLARAPEAEGFLPSLAAVRLEAELRLEERRLARRAHVLLGVHAVALAISVALAAASRMLDHRIGASQPALGYAGTLWAVGIVAISLWNLLRTADESLIPS